MRANKINHRKNKSSFSTSNKIARIVWSGVYLLLFRWTPDFFLNNYRLFILKLFGAKIGYGSIVYPTAKIWAPWNLEIGEYTCIGPNTDIYSMDKISIGSHVTVSQNAVICSGTHDINSHSMKLITKPIIINNYSWICAYAKILPGVSIGEGCVVGLDSVVCKSTDSWHVYAGNPAAKIKARHITDD